MNKANTPSITFLQNQSRLLEPTHPDINIDSGIFIVTGAFGALGKAYLVELSKGSPLLPLIGLHRRELTTPGIPGVSYRQADLLIKKNIDEALADIPFGSKQKITLIHTIGDFPKELVVSESIKKNTSEYNIAVDLFRSNFVTTRNIASAILERANGDVALIAYSSIMLEYGFPFFHAYNRAEHVMEKDLHRRISDHPNASAMIMYLPTLNTPKEHERRVHADTAKWYPPEELARHSLPLILNLGKDGFSGFQAVWAYTDYCPGFDKDRFASTFLERWHEERGLSQKDTGYIGFNGSKYAERK